MHFDSGGAYFQWSKNHHTQVDLVSNAKMGCSHFILFNYFCARAIAWGNCDKKNWNRASEVRREEKSQVGDAD